MSMNFNTANNTFRQLLANGLSYHIPPFQRDYSWADDEWDDLWQDITSLFEEDGESSHYMGYLVLQSSDNKEFDIIDGQQRITTISVMILAGLSYLSDLATLGLDTENNMKRKEHLQSSYIGYVNPVTLIANSKLELNRHNDRFYQTYLVPLEKMPQRGLHASEHLLRKSFNWFKERFSSRFGKHVDSGQKFAAMLDDLVDKLFFTVITVTDELNAFKVFETLNARGVRLSSTDLLKNYLFSLISSDDTHEQEIKALESRWEKIVGMLGNESFPEFLRVFWNSSNKLVRKSDLFKTIRRRIVSKTDAFNLVRDMEYSSEIYVALRDPMHSTWNDKEKEALQNIMMFNVKQPLAMLMACHRKFFDDHRKSFTRILSAVSIISLRYNVICGFPTHDQERVYNIAAKDISEGVINDLDEVLERIKEVYPDDRTFKSSFSSKVLKTTNSRNKKVVRYILFSIEKQCSGKDFDFESSIYNLEHILPENASESWSNFDESKQERCVYRLGNMTPMSASINRDIGNKGYDIKINEYKKSVFSITKAISENYDTWDESKIESRQKRLSEKAATIWKI